MSALRVGTARRALCNYGTNVGKAWSGTTLRVFLEFPGAFLKAYFGRRHFLRGIYGFMTAMNFAFYRYLRVAKTLERRRLRGKGIEPK